MRVIVTGGAGRLGTQVIFALAAAGHEVVSVDSTTHDLQPAEQHVIDLSAPGAANAAFASLQPDAVVHLAGIADPRGASGPDMLIANIGLAARVIEATEHSRARAFLFASSPAVIGYTSPHWSPTDLPIDETHPLAPAHAYAVSKVAIENLITMAAREAGTSVSWGAFRPGYVIAPDEWAGAPTQQGHTVTERLDDPALAAVSLFNYVDARDCADFVQMWLAAHKQLPNGSVYFTAAPDSLVREPLPEALARLVPSTATLATTLGANDAVFSSERARRDLGWEARRLWRNELVEPLVAKR